MAQFRISLSRSGEFMNQVVTDVDSASFQFRLSYEPSFLREIGSSEWRKGPVFVRPTHFNGETGSEAPAGQSKARIHHGPPKAPTEGFLSISRARALNPRLRVAGLKAVVGPPTRIPESTRSCGSFLP